MNVRPQLDGKDNPLSNEKVRQAMNYATNKDAIIQIVTHGVGTPMTSFMSSATPLHAGDKPLYPYDLEKAKALMKEAGFENGFETSAAGARRQPGRDRHRHGAAADVGRRSASSSSCSRSTTPPAPSNTATAPSPCASRRWTDDIADPNEITSYFVYSPTIDALHTGWKNEEADKLFEASQKEIDAGKRAEQYAKIQEIYNADGPIVPLYETPYPVALQQEGAGLPADPARQQHLRRDLAREVD